MLRRIKNLWAWSNIEPQKAYYTGKNVHVKEIESGIIINHIDPADELIETIREENIREA